MKAQHLVAKGQLEEAQDEIDEAMRKLQEENARLKAELDLAAVRQTVHTAHSTTLDLEIEQLKAKHSEDEGTFNNLLALKTKLQEEKEGLEKQVAQMKLEQEKVLFTLLNSMLLPHTPLTATLPSHPTDCHTALTLHTDCHAALTPH